MFCCNCQFMIDFSCPAPWNGASIWTKQPGETEIPIFTELFAEEMSESFPNLGTVEAFDTKIPLWKFIVPMILTFGLFSIFSTMWSIHLMNDHIRDQWAYEENLVRLIARHEGAIGVEYVHSDKEKTLPEKILMAFTR